MRDAAGAGAATEAAEEEDQAETEEYMNGDSELIINDSALNGDDSRDSSYNQLSIDTGEEAEPVKPPVIRVARGLQSKQTLNKQSEGGDTSSQIGILAAQLISGKRKSSSGTNGIGAGLPSKKIRPSAAETDAEISSLEKEIAGLEWLARRKEQEWDSAIRLLKQKEEKLVRAQRTKHMIQVETENLLTKYRQPAVGAGAGAGQQGVVPVIVPQQQVLLLPTSTQTTVTTRLIQPKPAATTPATTTTILRSSKSPSPAKQPVVLAAQESAEDSKAGLLVQQTPSRAATKKEKEKEKEKEEDKKQTPACQGCGKKKSEFVCAGCSNRWYCSRDCQVEDWDEHADDCSG